MAFLTKIYPLCLTWLMAIKGPQSIYNWTLAKIMYLSNSKGFQNLVSWQGFPKQFFIQFRGYKKWMTESADLCTWPHSEIWSITAREVFRKHPRNSLFQKHPHPCVQVNAIFYELLPTRFPIGTDIPLGSQIQILHLKKKIELKFSKVGVLWKYCEFKEYLFVGQLLASAITHCFHGYYFPNSCSNGSRRTKPFSNSFLNTWLDHVNWTLQWHWKPIYLECHTLIKQQV
jgi:hypothetical protein